MAESSKEILLSKLIESVPALLILLGAGMLILGLAGGITYNGWLPISEPIARIGALATGALLLIVAIYTSKSSKSSSPKPSNYGIKIEHPKQGDRVGIVDVRGTIKKAIPEGLTLQVLRIYPESDYFVPVGGKARIDIEAGTWEAAGCNIGGKTGDKRAIAAYLVGPSGNALVKYHNDASRVHRRTLDQLREAQMEGEFLPPIELRTQDMTECDRVTVWRI